MPLLVIGPIIAVVTFVAPEPSATVVGWFVSFPFVVLSAVGALGWKRPKAAGRMLIVLTLAPVVFFSRMGEGDLHPGDEPGNESHPQAA